MNNKINFKKSSKSKIIKLSTSSKELENKLNTHTHTHKKMLRKTQLREKTGKLGKMKNINVDKYILKL